MRPAFTHAGRALFITASIGVAFAMADRESSGEDLLRDADLAMYRAKRNGKDHLCVYDPTMHDDAEDRLRLDGELRGALGRGELLLHYQPIYGIDGHPLVAVEALMRWNHPPANSSRPLSSSPSPRPAASSSRSAAGPWTRPAASSGTGRTPRLTALPMTSNSASTSPPDNSPMTTCPPSSPAPWPGTTSPRSG
jgi:hypothetical protein